MPASAHTVYKLAHGVLGSAVADHRNRDRAGGAGAGHDAAISTSPAVARNVERLREDGMYVVSPRAGIEVSNPTGAPIEDVVGSVAGIAIPNPLAVLLAILTAHRNAGMD